MNGNSKSLLILKYRFNKVTTVPNYTGFSLDNIKPTGDVLVWLKKTLSYTDKDIKACFMLGSIKLNNGNVIVKTKEVL